MVIGLDIDGTITRHPKFFALVSQALVQGGHQVVVITFREDRKSAADDFAVWGVAYSELVTWSSMENAGENMYAWKARRCTAKNVEILFDDDPLVLCQLNPVVVSMMVVDHETHDLARRLLYFALLPVRMPGRRPWPECRLLLHHCTPGTDKIPQLGREP